MAMATSTKPPSSNFLYQVLTLPTKNTKLFLPLFTIITLINFIFILCNFFSMQHLSADIALKAQALVHTDPIASPDYSLLITAIQKDTKELLIELIIFTVISFFVNSLLTIITFFAVAATCSGELLTLRELLVKTKRNMKGPIITYFFGVFLGLLCALPLILIALFPLFIKKGSYTFIVFSILALVLFLLVLLLLLYLSIVWPLSMAVSVIETGCYGPRAFKRAAKLAKEKKMKGFLIILASFLLFGALYAINKMILKYNSSSRASVLVLGFFYTFFGELVAMYILIAVVIYYYECKKSRGEGEEGEDGLVYKMVLTKALHVDEELP